MIKYFSILFVVVATVLLSIACAPTAVDKMDKRAMQAVAIGDWGEASYFASQMYDLLPECNVGNLVSLSLIYNRLADLTPEIETRQNYIERMIDCYEKACEINSNKAERKYKDAHMDMAEKVRRSKQLLLKYKQVNGVGE